MARGVPLSASKRRTIPWIVGRPNRSRLPGKFAFVLAAK
jgi:hypothetical protein